MARRRTSISSGWVFRQGSQALTYNSTTATNAIDPILGFEDIDDGATIIARERSDYHFVRILFWFYIGYDPTGSGNPEALPVHCRLGTLSDDMTMSTAAAAAAPSMDASNWIRIFQEDSVMVYESEGLPRDSIGLACDTTPSLASTIYPIPPKLHRWDISAKFRLGEDTSLAFQWGPWVAGTGIPIDNDLFTAAWCLKALLQKKE